jgi:hypothetical protein
VESDIDSFSLFTTTNRMSFAAHVAPVVEGVHVPVPDVKLPFD